MKRFVLALVFVAQAFRPALANAQWMPPAGVPTPPLGIVDTVTTPTTLATTFTANCPADRPCLASGGNYHWLTVTGGSNLIVEKATLYGCAIAAGATNITIRDSVIVGDLSGGGCTVGNGSAGAAHNVTFLRDIFHDIGDVNAKTDIDAHCLGIGYESDHVWVLDSVFYRCGGDGVQVNGGIGLPNWRNLNHIYIGRNTFTHNRQSAVWVKNSADVVVSENVCTHMRANSGGPGTCYGSQYGSDRLVVIGNRGSDAPYGYAAQSDSPGFGSGLLLYGNVFYGLIHDPNNGTPTLQNAYSDNAALLLAGGVTRILLHNTIVNVGGGLGIPASGGNVSGANNLIAKASRAHVALEGTTVLNLQKTLFGEPPIFYQASAANSIIGAPVFNDVPNADWTLVQGPGKGAAAAINPNDAYKAISGGVDYRTVHGIDLPAPGTDIGAFGSALLPHPLTEPGAAPPVITPVPPSKPPLPDCPRNFWGALAYIAGRCHW